MKKSELQQMIKEEYQKMNEGKDRDGYDLDNLGGGWSGDVYINWAKDSVSVHFGLYSGGSGKSEDHKFPMLPKLKELVKKMIKSDSEGDAAGVAVNKISKSIEKEIQVGVNSELAKFDKSVGNIIKKAVTKYNK